MHDICNYVLHVISCSHATDGLLATRKLYVRASGATMASTTTTVTHPDGTTISATTVAGLAGGRISSRPFGVCSTGAAATLYTLRNAAGLTASITDFGATLQSLCLPDRDGKLEDCILGFDSQ
eukprot:SAG11_NODE_1380_length_5081_cov_6.100963_6_plen_123_part_00